MLRHTTIGWMRLKLEFSLYTEHVYIRAHDFLIYIDVYIYPMEEMLSHDLYLQQN